MNVEQALDVAHTIKRNVGVSHCGEPGCEFCAAKALAAEVQRQRSEIEGLRRLLDARPAPRPRHGSMCRHCSGQLVDGICPECDA